MKIQTLLEKTFDIQSDVDMIYNQFFKKTLDSINSKKWDGYWLQPANITTHVFTSPDGISGNKIAPCEIRIGRGGGNTYHPQKMIITLNLHEAALKYVNSMGNDLEKTIEAVPYTDRSAFRNEFNEGRVKGTISHEISHWLDDITNNRHIDKYTKNRSAASVYDGSKVDFGMETSKKFEINAQIHAVMELRKSMPLQRWNFMTFDDLIGLSAPLRSVRMSLQKDSKVYNQWRRDFLARMARENILGTKMR